MTRFVRLIQPEPYRAVGNNTVAALTVTQTLRAPRKKMWKVSRA